LILYLAGWNNLYLIIDREAMLKILKKEQKTRYFHDLPVQWKYKHTVLKIMEQCHFTA
jgi:hypothetical protein